MSKEILEDALNHYSGTVFYVSHDRYFINRTAHRILELSDCTLTNYLGNYDYYLEKKESARTALAADMPHSDSAGTHTDTEAKTDWKLQRQLQARRRKLENDLKKTESTIEQLEQENSELDNLMSQPEICTDALRLGELSEKKEENLRQLTKLYEHWEELSEEA
jgi:ATP-binding cassette subfamily F protein 3